MAYCFQKRQGFDVTHGATDFDHRHIRAICAQLNAAFYFVGDVWDDLDCATQIIATTFFANDIFVNLAGGEIVAFGHASADEAFVVTEIKIGFRAVVGDEYFTVLKRAHGARINIDVRIKLQQGDFETAGFEDGAQRGCSNALS